MRILIVEDEDASRDETVETVLEIDPDANVVTAASRDEAVRSLNEDEFDLIICDLKIPPQPNDLGADESHGLAVHAAAQDTSRGTPVIFLTGKATPKNLRSQLSGGDVVDLYGGFDSPMVQLAVKDGSGEEVDLIADFASRLSSLTSCALVCAMEPSELLTRATLIYGKRLGAVSADLRLFSGLSGAEVARARFSLPNGQTRLILIKLQDRDEALDELSRYHRNIPNKLPVGYFAPAVNPALHGLRKKAALYYTLASDMESFFALCSRSPEQAARVVETMARNHKAWTDEQSILEVSIGDLRRHKLSDGDDRASGLWAAAWQEDVEALSVSIPTCMSHGDLHGENVLVDPSGRPTLIDYGDVQSACSAIDPLTLELSLVFHAAGPARGSSWLTPTQLRLWCDIDAYVAGSELEPVIRACRSWASDVASERAILAGAYAHTVRQLKYPDVENELALAVAHSIAEELLARTW